MNTHTTGTTHKHRQRPQGTPGATPTPRTAGHGC